MPSRSRWVWPWLVALALGLPRAVSGQDATPPPPPPEEPLLELGPFAVGFESTWAFDEGRTYRTAYDGGKTYGAQKSARPLLVLSWYPARAAEGAHAMTYRDYFAITGQPEHLEPYAQALRAHALGIFVEQVLGQPEAELDDAGRAELERLLDSPTPCRLGAPPAEGRFPLVLHHSGAGSSFEDNAALCELLASHGYVVLASAFPEADGSELGIDGGPGSADDARFLVRWASALEHVDWDKVALVGHSAGAQAFLKYAAAPGCVADALVLLDTTQDYYGLSLPLHQTLVEQALAGVAQLTRPMLVAAGPEAFFALCDTLVEAERTYLTVPELGHDEFISQGLQRLRRRAALAEDTGADERARLSAVRAGYRTLCETVVSFLDAMLDPADPRAADFAARVDADRRLGWSHDAPRLVSVPRGTSAPERYDTADPRPPSPRQFAQLLMKRGAASACEVLERFRDEEPRGPLYTSTMLAGSLLHGLARAGRMHEVRVYYAELQQLEVPVLSVFEFLADIAALQGKTERARELLRFACEVDPSDEHLAAKLAELAGPAERAEPEPPGAR